VEAKQQMNRFRVLFRIKGNVPSETLKCARMNSVCVLICENLTKN